MHLEVCLGIKCVLSEQAEKVFISIITTFGSFLCTCPVNIHLLSFQNQCIAPMAVTTQPHFESKRKKKKKKQKKQRSEGMPPPFSQAQNHYSVSCMLSNIYFWANTRFKMKHLLHFVSRCRSLKNKASLSFLILTHPYLWNASGDWTLKSFSEHKAREDPVGVFTAVTLGK